MVWAPSYITDAQLALFARTTPEKVAGYAAAASRAVDDFCNQQFGQVDEVTTFSYDTARVGRLPNGRFLVMTDPIYRADGLVVEDDGTEITAGTSGYLLWPRNSNTATGVEPYAGVMLTDPPSGGYLDVTSRYFGWAAVPPGVVLATKIQGNRWAARGESPYGVAGSPSEGSEVKLSARLDVDARTPLGFPGGIRLRRPR
jgi:hypothetical protein